jgi:shikimate dehydrogenase
MTSALAAGLQPRVSGATRLLGIIGDPIRQVRSPETFNPQLAAAGHDTLLVPIHIEAATFDAAIGGVMAIANLDGLVVTMPFKGPIMAHLTRISDRARQVGAVNAARRTSDGGWEGDMFDGVGLVGAVQGLGIDLPGLRVGLLGAGGAGSAIAFALAASGVAKLSIVDRTAGRAEALARRVAAAHGPLPDTGSFAIGDVDLLINATPIGMKPDDGTPLDVSGLTPSTSIVDIVTRPEGTPLLAAAARAGCRHAGGAAMVAAQTAAIIEFFGLAPAKT